MEKKPNIEQGYINRNNEHFENLRHIRLDNMEQFCEYEGKTISSTYSVDSMNYTSGVRISEASYDPSKALRIYYDYLDGSSHSDERMISTLIDRQKNVKLTEFPTGIITLENKIIGQEIPYYRNYNTLFDVISNNENILPTELYIKVLKSLKELLDNEIVYKDIHAKNFLLDQTNSILRIIDFEPHFVSLESKYGQGVMINNLKAMIKKLNGIRNIRFSKIYKKTNTFNEVEECIYDEHIKLMRKNNL